MSHLCWGWGLIIPRLVGQEGGGTTTSFKILSLLSKIYFIYSIWDLEFHMVGVEREKSEHHSGTCSADNQTLNVNFAIPLLCQLSHLFPQPHEQALPGVHPFIPSLPPAGAGWIL